MAREATRLVAARAEARGVDVAREGVPGSVRGRPSELTRMLRNLLENAIAHSPRGGTVRVACRRRPPRLELEVADEGEGVADADRERIFEPFFRGAKASAETDGAGLGLGISRDIARHHGGDVALAPGRAPGARFVVSLPEAPAAPSPGPRGDA